MGSVYDRKYSGLPALSSNNNTDNTCPGLLWTSRKLPRKPTHQNKDFKLHLCHIHITHILKVPDTKQLQHYRWLAHFIQDTGQSSFYWQSMVSSSLTLMTMTAKHGVLKILIHFTRLLRSIKIRAWRRVFQRWIIGPNFSHRNSISRILPQINHAFHDLLERWQKY